MLESEVQERLEWRRPRNEPTEVRSVRQKNRQGFYTYRIRTGFRKQERQRDRSCGMGSIVVPREGVEEGVLKQGHNGRMTPEGPGGYVLTVVGWDCGGKGPSRSKKRCRE